MASARELTIKPWKKIFALTELASCFVSEFIGNSPTNPFICVAMVLTPYEGWHGGKDPAESWIFMTNWRCGVLRVRPTVRTPRVILGERDAPCFLICVRGSRHSNRMCRQTSCGQELPEPVKPRAEGRPEGEMRCARRVGEAGTHPTFNGPRKWTDSN